MIKKLICRIFGHKYPSPYAKVVDGGKVWTFPACQRCGRKPKVGWKWHGGFGIMNKNWKLRLERKDD